MGLRIVSLTRTRFEGDVIEEFIRHTLQFADRCYVVDNASFDGTAEILQSLLDEGLPLTVWSDDILEFYEDTMDKYARRVFAEDDAAYLMMLDPDEFLKAKSREQLEEALSQLPEDAHATLPWMTYVPSAGDPEDDRVLARIRKRRSNEGAGHSKVIVSRTMLKHVNATIAPGSHFVKDDEAVQHVELAGVTLAHFPVRSLPQIQGKALLGWPSFLLRGYDRRHGLKQQWRQIFESLRNGAQWSADDVPRIAAEYAGGDSALPALVPDPIAPVERRYAHQAMPLSAVAAAYARQLATHARELRQEIGQVRGAALRAKVQSEKPGVVFLHAGTHRTGTSSIQATLDAQHEALAAQGIYVPLPGGDDVYQCLAAHHEAADYFLHYDDYRNEPLARLIEDLARAAPEVAVVSSENYSALYAKREVLERIAGAYADAGFLPRILLYVREQGSYAESLYAELVKHGLNRSFESYLDEVLEAGAVAYEDWAYCFEYVRLADAFAEVFGRENVIVRPFNPLQENRVLLDDFFVQLGVAPGTLPLQPVRINRSATFQEVLDLLYLRAVNRKEQTPNSVEIVEHVLARGEREFLDKPFSILSEMEAERIAERFKADNVRLAERYGAVVPAASPRPQNGLTLKRRVLRVAEVCWSLNA